MSIVCFESVWNIMKSALEHWCPKLQNLAEFSLSVLNFGLLNPKVQPFITQNLSTFWRKTLIDKFEVWYEIFILGFGAKYLVAWISSYGLAKLGTWTLFFHNLIFKFLNFTSFASNLDFLINSWSNAPMDHIFLNNRSWWKLLSKKSNFDFWSQMNFVQRNPNSWFLIDASLEAISNLRMDS